MSAERVLDLAECSEFHQTLQARPPAIVHGTAIVLGTLLAAAAVWAWLSHADLVVQGAARVRVRSASPRSFTHASGGDEVFAQTGGRVVEVRFQRGATVKRGDLLARLDTERQDNEIDKQERVIQAGEDELAMLDRIEAAQARQLDTLMAKTDAELARASRDVRHAHERQDADVQAADAELANAQAEEARLRPLIAQGAASEGQLRDAEARVAQASQRDKNARLEVDTGDAAVLGREREQVKAEYDVKREQLQSTRVVKRGELDAAKKTLANLQVERRQAEIVAPADGVVTVGDVKVGDIVQPGQALAEIAQDTGLEIDVAIAPADVSDVHLGMPVQIRLDAFDPTLYGTLAGTIDYVSPIAETMTSTYGSATYFLVRVAIDRDQLERGDRVGEVKVGMTGSVEIVTRRERIMSLVFQRLRRTFRLE